MAENTDFQRKDLLLKKIQFVLSLLLLVIMVILLVIRITTRPSYSDVDKIYQKQLNELKKDFDKLRQDDDVLKIKQGVVISEINDLKQQRKQIDLIVQGYKNELSSIKKEYAKNRNYNSVPVDSLGDLFTRQYGN